MIKWDFFRHGNIVCIVFKVMITGTKEKQDCDAKPKPNKIRSFFKNNFCDDQILRKKTAILTSHRRCINIEHETAKKSRLH